MPDSPSVSPWGVVLGAVLAMAGSVMNHVLGWLGKRSDRTAERKKLVREKLETAYETAERVRVGCGEAGQRTRASTEATPYIRTCPSGN
jgi:hypothetical protein